MRAGPAFAATLYALLVGSAALALFAQKFPGSIPHYLERAAPWVFMLFVAGFAAYRLALVRAGKYSAAKAFFQIGASALFFALLLAGGASKDRAAGDDVTKLLSDSRPSVRAMAAEVARFRPDGKRYGPALTEALLDKDPRVAEQAHRSLVVLSGVDLGGPGDPKAVEAWQERFR